MTNHPENDDPRGYDNATSSIPRDITTHGDAYDEDLNSSLHISQLELSLGSFPAAAGLRPPSGYSPPRIQRSGRGALATAGDDGNEDAR